MSLRPVILSLQMPRRTQHSGKRGKFASSGKTPKSLNSTNAPWNKVVSRALCQLNYIADYAELCDYIEEHYRTLGRKGPLVTNWRPYIRTVVQRSPLITQQEDGRYALRREDAHAYNLRGNGGARRQIQTESLSDSESSHSSDKDSEDSAQDESRAISTHAESATVPAPPLPPPRQLSEQERATQRMKAILEERHSAVTAPSDYVNPFYRTHSLWFEPFLANDSPTASRVATDLFLLQFYALKMGFYPRGSVLRAHYERFNWQHRLHKQYHQRLNDIVNHL